MASESQAVALELSPPRVPAGTLVYAVGDIHGCADLLEKMHAEIIRDAGNAEAERRVVVYLGDYVDRGPDSSGVVDLLLDKPLEGFESYYLMGNHEDFLLEFLDDPEIGPGWIFNGGAATLESYGVKADFGLGFGLEELVELQEKFVKALPERHLEFYRKLAFTHEEGDYFFVHAGVRPGVPLENQSDEDMLWIREEFLDSLNNHGKVIVHGHTITWEPEFRVNRIGVDTGAFTSGTLTSLVLESHEQDVLQVDADV
ncbi:MAG: metallophosphoesterase family protein [Pseudomonadota bacterium]